MGINFKIVTDCAAFQRTVNKTDVPPRVQKMTFYLQVYDCVIEHSASARMKNVDALSRYPVLIAYDLITTSIKRAQSGDDKIISLIKLLDHQPYDNYLIKNSLLFKQKFERDLLVVSEEIEKSLIGQAHEKGHFSVEKTMKLLEQDFYFDNMRDKYKHLFYFVYHVF